MQFAEIWTELTSGRDSQERLHAGIAVRAVFQRREKGESMNPRILLPKDGGTEHYEEVYHGAVMVSIFFLDNRYLMRSYKAVH